MDNNNNNPTPQPGSESLNERLRRAAEMARRNMAAENTPPTRPVAVSYTHLTLPTIA